MTSYVYFIQRENGRLIKIGYASSNARLAEHRRNGFKLLGVMPGGREKETELHDRFEHLRVDSDKRQRRELFRPDPELIGFIEDNTDFNTGVAVIAATIEGTLYEKLRNIAARNQRSLSKEVAYVLIQYAEGFDEDGRRIENEG